jgi:hypothetical protein
MARLAAGVAVMLSFLAASVLIFVDTYSSRSCSSDSSGVMQCVDSSSTLIEENGAWVLILLSVPVSLALGLYLSIELGASSLVKGLLAAVLVATCLVAITSVGLFFLPAALVAAVAVFLDRPQNGSQPT